MRDNDSPREATKGKGNKARTSVAEAAHFLGVSEKTVRRMVDTGELPAARVRDRVTLGYDDLLEYLRAHAVKARPIAPPAAYL